jgi:putative membrane protein
MRKQIYRKASGTGNTGFLFRNSLHWILNAAVLLIVAVFVPGFYVPRLWAGLTVVMVIGLSNAGLGFFLEKIGLRLAASALVAISFVLNVLILKLASAILPGFYMRTLAAALIGAFALAFIQVCFGLFESRTNKQKALV